MQHKLNYEKSKEMNTNTHYDQSVKVKDKERVLKSVRQ